ncbi:uncharacterized protein PG986_014205 [Apiospora aurea]|uniref:Uncharacterized protein n=1 Tax=Apiospora aurea TaxID=335848 RepID=A0ABR1PSB5_9PEZI
MQPGGSIMCQHCQLWRAVVVLTTEDATLTAAIGITQNTTTHQTPPFSPNQSTCSSSPSSPPPSSPSRPPAPLRAAVDNSADLALARRAEETQDSLAKLQEVGPKISELLQALADKQNSPSVASVDGESSDFQAADFKVQDVIQDILNALGGTDGIKNIVKTVMGLIPGASNFQGIVDSALNIVLPLITGGAKGNGSGAGAGATTTASAAPAATPAPTAAPAKNNTAKAAAFNVDEISYV